MERIGRFFFVAQLMKFRKDVFFWILKSRFLVKFFLQFDEIVFQMGWNHHLVWYYTRKLTCHLKRNHFKREALYFRFSGEYLSIPFWIASKLAGLLYRCFFAAQKIGAFWQPNKNPVQVKKKKKKVEKVKVRGFKQNATTFQICSKLSIGSMKPSIYS